jgi:hypothetical protein
LIHPFPSSLLFFLPGDLPSSPSIQHLPSKRSIYTYVYMYIYI